MYSKSHAEAEVLTGVQKTFQQERVIYGKPAASTVVEEVELLGKQRVFVITSGSLSGADALPAEIGRALGLRFAGMFASVTSHTPRQCVIDGAAAARAAGADLLVAVGGGSVIDATKVMLLCLWHDITDIDGLDPYVRPEVEPSRRPFNSDGMVRMIAVPTMFAAAEFTWYAGVTDPRRRVKEGFRHSLFVPQSVVLDPRATMASPLHQLRATGMKAVDHAVERICGLVRAPLGDATAVQAFKLLFQNLPRLGGEADCLDVRLDCQLGMWLSIFGSSSGVPVGASHAIGHVLGGYGVPHGHTTGLILPAVLTWNYSANACRQAEAGAAIGVSGEAFAVAIRDLAETLNMPTRLRDADIDRNDLDDIANKSLHDRPMATNPRRVTTADQVREILEIAW